MLLLALESSTSLGSVALLKDGVILGEESSSQQRSHSEFLNAALSRLIFSVGIGLKEVDIVSVSTGPGSFTGVRVAGSLAKSLAYSLKKEIWAIDSLSVLASMPAPAQDSQILVGINAFKNMVYCSCFRDGQNLVGPCVVELAEFDHFIARYFPNNPISFVGDAIEVIQPSLSHQTKARLTPTVPPVENPTAAAIGKLFFSAPEKGKTLDWKSFVPLYLRGSEAEENLRLRAPEKL